jgi:3-isopropylmalate/(R)-2-methylmalate dehydratase large subunit
MSTTAAGPQTIAQKIIARAAGRDHVTPDEVLWVDVDLAMMHDSSGPRRIRPAMNELGVGVWDPERIVLVCDHYVPANTVAAAEILQTTRDFASTFGIERFHEAQGIAHTLMVEKGYARPGMLYVGSDSHTCTAGVMGCLALGVGSTDILGVVTTGRTWLRVPHTIKVVLDGRLRPGVTAKDLILTIIGDHGMDGALYQVLEFTGSAIEAMSIQERSVLTNMCAEIGAKTGVVPCDAVTVEHLASLGVEAGEGPFSDTEAEYSQVWRYDTSTIEPVVARPNRHDDVVAISGLGEPTVGRAYIGSCTGAKYEDLAMAARVLEGRRVADGVLLQVAPASRAALQQAMADGTAQTLMEAGAHILSTGCGACPGIGAGILAAGEVAISTTNRNFRGRMGSPESSLYLASPYAVAAAAVAGRIVDPRDYLEEPALVSAGGGGDR